MFLCRLCRVVYHNRMAVSMTEELNEARLDYFRACQKTAAPPLHILIVIVSAAGNYAECAILRLIVDYTVLFVYTP